MKKKIWKTLFQALFVLILFGCFVGMLVFLNDASDDVEEDVMTWEPEVMGGYSDQWETVAENDSLKLLFQPSTTQLVLEDKSTGTQWRSNPENAAEDSVAFGQNKTLVQSVLNVDYVNDQSNFYTMNSFQGSVQKQTYTYEYQENGVMVNWMFPDGGFEIPCYFGIEKDRFVARVLTEQIVQHGLLQVSKVALLPFFGAGSLEDEGYMVVPDGSGALINFNNQKQAYVSYTQTVYGRDLALNLQNNTLVTQDATMPLFGIRKNDDALLAVITEGAFQAEIAATVSRKITSNNTVYSSVALIQSENNTLLPNSGDEEIVTMTSPQQLPSPYYEVSYFFLEKEAGYAEMAARYQRYLVEEKGMQPSSTDQMDMNLSFLGGVQVRDTFLGVPYHTVRPLTPYEDLQDAVLSLQEATGGKLLVSMSRLEKDGTESKLPTKLTYEGALGGAGDYKRMAAALESAGIPFYPVYDPITMYHAGHGYSTLKTVRNVSRNTSPQYTYLLTSGARDSGREPAYLLSPEYAEKVMSKLLASAAKKNVTRLGLTGITRKTYSDFRKEDVSRDQTGDYWEAALQQAGSSSEELLFAGAYAYAFPYADVITEVPTSSSQFDMEDASIPFYQMVMSGYAALYGTPVNMSGNVDEAFLRCVEYGVNPSFLLITEGGEALLDTELSDAYGAAYDSWEPRIEEFLGRLKELDGTLGQKIIGHRQAAEDVYATSYEDGTVVYVNYGDEEATVEGVTVPASGFARKGGE